MHPLVEGFFNPYIIVFSENLLNENNQGIDEFFIVASAVWFFQFPL
jgi:hypothetical protein